MPPETLQEKANRIAIQFGISTTTLSNLIYSESRWNPNATSSQGDRGIAQINFISHAEVKDACAFDPECAIRWTAQRIKQGYSDEWVACNCYSYLKTKIKNLPKMDDIVPNSKPQIGGVAIFYYGHGTKHVSYIKDIGRGILTLQESNFQPCLISPREVSVDNKNLVGFWYPPSGG